MQKHSRSGTYGATRSKTCRNCISGLRDAKGRRRCTEVDSGSYQNIVSERFGCAKWAPKE